MITLGISEIVATIITGPIYRFIGVRYGFTISYTIALIGGVGL
jgi:hypothetical protein